VGTLRGLQRSFGGRSVVVNTVGGSRAWSGNVWDSHCSRPPNDIGLLTPFRRLLTTHQRPFTSQHELSSPLWDFTTTTHDLCTPLQRLSAIGRSGKKAGMVIRRSEAVPSSPDSAVVGNTQVVRGRDSRTAKCDRGLIGYSS